MASAKLRLILPKMNVFPPFWIKTVIMWELKPRKMNGRSTVSYSIGDFESIANTDSENTLPCYFLLQAVH